MIKAATALLFLSLNAYIYYGLATQEVIPTRRPFSEFPLALDDWSCPARLTMDQKTLANLGVSDYLICQYSSGGANVGVYVGYHETQIRREGGGAGENSIHPPEHCLPGSGWNIVDSRNVRISLPGVSAEPVEVKRFLIAKGADRQLVYFWYETQGRVIAKNHELILYRFWDRATKARTDGSLVRITIPIGSGGEAEAEGVFQRFIEKFVPRLPTYLPS